MTPEQQVILERIRARQSQSQPAQVAQAPAQPAMQSDEQAIVSGRVRGITEPSEIAAQNQATQPATTQGQQSVLDRVRARRLNLPPKTIATSRGERPNPAYDAFVEDLAEGKGSYSAADLPSDVLQDAQRKRLDNIPELAKVGIKNISDNPSMLQALASISAFDPVEVGQIIAANDPNVELIMPSRDEALLYNRQKGTVANVNQVGPSLMDALQFGGAASLFGGVGALTTRLPGYAAQTTAQRAGTIGLAEGATQAGLETLQESQGGQFDAAEVGLAAGLGAAAPVLAEGARRLGPVVAARVRDFIQRRAPFRQLINPDDLLPTPAFERELQRQGLVYGDIIDDIEQLAAQGADADPRTIAEQIAVRKLEQGDPSKSLVGRRLVNGRPVDDDLAKEAVRQGIKAEDVQSLKTANAPTKSRMLQMLGLRRRMQILSDEAIENRPSDIAGNEAFERYKFIQGEAAKLRNQLNDIAEREFPENTLPAPGSSTAPGLRQLNVDVKPIKDEYVRLLNDLDIVATRTPDGGLKLDFGDSIVSKNAGSKKIIKDITDLLLKPQGPEFNAAQFHKIKLQIDDLINWRKATITGIPETGRDFAKNIRFQINQALREASPEYARVNDQLSKAIQAMESFDDVMGRRFDPYKERADETVGQALRKLMSNFDVRNDMITALKNIDKVAADLGQNFDVNLNKLVNFNYALQDRFGAEGRSTLTGNLQTAQRAERLLTEGPTREGIRVAAEKIAGKLGPDEEKAFNALQRLLRRGD